MALELPAPKFTPAASIGKVFQHLLFCVGSQIGKLSGWGPPSPCVESAKRQRRVTGWGDKEQNALIISLAHAVRAGQAAAVIPPGQSGAGSAAVMRFSPSRATSASRFERSAITVGD